MKKNILYLTFAFSFLVFQLSAQSFKCGVTTSMGLQIQEQMIQDRIEMRDYVSTRNAITYLPVRFFLVAESNGTGRVSERVAFEALCLMNNNYADQEIQFYIKEFKYVNNSNIYDNSQSAAGFNALKNQMLGKYNAINIFIADEAGGGSAAYYQPPASGPNRNDWILTGDGEGDDFEVMTHELGHYFNLNHPYFGWESSGGWNLAEHGNPVGLNSPSGIPNEFADGSNCADAADMLCDTPADYFFPFAGPDNCTYNLDVKDPNGDLIAPDLTNFMNNSSCDDEDYHFTPMQKDAIENNLFSSSRNYLPKGDVPNLGVVESLPTILSPQQSETIETYNSVPLEWTDVPNAESYFVEVINIGGGTNRYIVNDTQVTLTDLEPESSYFWNVIGYNEYSTCQNNPTNKIFKTGSDTVTDTNEIPQLKEWTLQPNPVNDGEVLNVIIESGRALTIDISLSTITGQTVALYKDQQFANGVSFFEIDTYGMPAGIYLVSLRTPNGIETKRVSIL